MLSMSYLALSSTEHLFYFGRVNLYTQRDKTLLVEIKWHIMNMRA